MVRFLRSPNGNIATGVVTILAGLLDLVGMSSVIGSP